MSKRALFTVALLMTVTMLTGCWDRREINDVAFVMTTGMDKEADDQYRVTVQVALPGQLGGIGGSGGGGGTSGARPYFNDSCVGVSLRDANGKQQRRLSRELHYGHRRVVVVGEDLAKEGIDKLMDSVGRLPQNRLTAFLLITKGQARDIMNADMPTEQFPAEVMRELAQSSMKHPRTLKHVVNQLVVDGLDVTVPYVEMMQSQPGEQGKPQQTIKNAGVAVFRHNHLAGVLLGEQGNALLLAMNEGRSPTFTLKPPEGEGVVTVILTENTAQVEPTFQGDKIRVKIDIQGKGYVMENQSNYDISIDNNLGRIGQVAADRIRQSVLDSMKLLQNEYHSDPLGIGNAIHRADPERWKKLSKDWESEYAKLEVEVNPLVHIEHSGMYTSPMGRKKGEIE